MYNFIIIPYGYHYVIFHIFSIIIIPYRYPIIFHCHWLVVSTPLKNMLVSWNYYSQYMESQSKFHGSKNHQPVIINHY